MENVADRIRKKGQISFLTLVTVALVLGVFIVATISFGSQMATDNNSSMSITNDPEINASYQDFTQQLRNASTNITSSKGTFFSDIPVFSGIVATITVIFGVVPGFFDLMIGSYSLVGDLIQTKLGVPKIILNMFTAIIMFVGILLAWRVYKAGS